eukprot:scaffold183745_cov14-Tisochrysis_lutea.AAC.1
MEIHVLESTCTLHRCFPLQPNEHDRWYAAPCLCACMLANLPDAARCDCSESVELRRVKGWPQGESPQTGMPEDDPSPQEQQRCPDPHGDVSKPEQSTESPSPPFMISNQGVNDQFFELLRHDAPLPQQQVLFNLSLPTRVTRTHSCDGAGTLGDAAGSHKNDADEQHMRSAFGVRKPVGSHPGSKSGDHAVAMSSMPLHQSLGKD